MFGYKSIRPQKPAAVFALVTVILLGTAFVSVPANAQESQPTPSPTPSPTPAPTPPPMPVIEKVVGQPVTVTWFDGRKAMVEVSAPIIDKLAMRLQLSESTCTPSSRLQCEYKAGFGLETYRLVWTAHADSTRVGKVVRFGYTVGQLMDRRTDLVEPITTAMVDGLVDPSKFANLPPDELSCPSWDWLGKGTGIPASLTLPAVSSEFMFENPNTGLQENKTIMTATDIVWKKTEPNVLQVQSVASYTSVLPLGGFNALFLGDVMKWTIEKSTNQYCEAAFKVDVTPLQAAFGEIIKRSAALPFTPFLHRTVEPFTAGLNSGQLQRVLTGDPNYHSQYTVYE